jgi:hypothetical protein
MRQSAFSYQLSAVGVSFEEGEEEKWLSQIQRMNREERHPQPLTLKNTPKNAVQAGQANTRAGNGGRRAERFLFFLAYACPLFFEGRGLRVEKMTKHRFTVDFEKAIEVEVVSKR